MAPRKRLFTELDRKALLRALGALRDACVAASKAAPIQGPEYRAVGRVVEAVHDAAELLTGRRDAFQSAGFERLGEGRVVVRPGEFTADDRALVMDVLAAELVTSPDTPEVREEMHGPIADRIIAALEGKDQGDRQELEPDPRF